MVSKKNKDAESGLQVLGILGMVWTIGVFYLTRNGDIAGIELNQLSLACCNSINILLTIIILASWRYTKRENRTKDYLEEHFATNDSISVEHLIKEFRMSQSSTMKILDAWMKETTVRGNYDASTGVFKREPVETVSSGIIDIEAHDVLDEENEQ